MKAKKALLKKKSSETDRDIEFPGNSPLRQAARSWQARGDYHGAGWRICWMRIPQSSRSAT